MSNGLSRRDTRRRDCPIKRTVYHPPATIGADPMVIRFFHLTHRFPRASHALLLLNGLWLGCAAPGREGRDWSAYQGPGAEHFHREEVQAFDFTDPLEGWNRIASGFNEAALLGFIEPLTRVYRAGVPQEARDAIRRAGLNLLFPRNALANLAKGDADAAWWETRRFAINSTIGLAGLFDPAATMGLPSSDQDFGLTFGEWGWRPSKHLVVPLLGLSTVRDTAGYVPDTLTDPLFYLTSGYVRPFFTLNEQTGALPRYRQFVRTSPDPYMMARILWTVSRESRLLPPLPPVQVDDTPATQTLAALHLTCREPRFPRMTRERYAYIPATRRKLPYTFRLQPVPAPIVYILPGLGAHRESDAPMALAELFFDRGYSVAIISSTFCEEFMDRAATVALPGHAVRDADDILGALAAVDEDLRWAFRGQLTHRALVGYSMGGFLALTMAARDVDAKPGELSFDRYIAVDTPVRLAHAMEQLDRYYNAPLSLPPEQRADHIRDTLRRGLQLLSDLAAPGEPARMSDAEARFLIGASYRLSLISTIFESQRRKNLGIVASRLDRLERGPAYNEITGFSFMEYAFAMVGPCFAARAGQPTDVEAVLARNDLRSFEAALRTNEKIRVFANRNDFLLGDEDVAWLESVFRGRIRVADQGGHMGGLFREDAQQALVDALDSLGY